MNINIRDIPVEERLAHTKQLFNTVVDKLTVITEVERVLYASGSKEYRGIIHQLMVASDIQDEEWWRKAAMTPLKYVIKDMEHAAMLSAEAKRDAAWRKSGVVATVTIK